MVEYWPNTQGLHLNNEVAHLFSNIQKKFSYNLSNITNNNLYIDILSNRSKNQLFNIILKELEVLILDIIELNLNIKNIKILNHKILYDIIYKSSISFINKLSTSEIFILNINEKKFLLLKRLFLEDKLLIENLLIYIIFGSSKIKSEYFAFNSIKTPREHVSILLENLIIQISNSVIFLIIENLKSIPKITNFLISNQLCNYIYISNRSIALFRNQLIWQDFLYLYIYQPKLIYSSRYKVWLISSNGLIAKYIHTLRSEDLLKLSKIKRIFIFYMEIQDLIIPKLEKTLLICSKILLYIFINILGNCLIFFIRTIISGFYPT